MAGLVAAGHPETVRAACAVLSDGGNAVDAALAGMCAAAIAEPVLASLGGGGFLISRLARGPQAGRISVHDFFVQTPGRRRAENDVAVHDVAADFGPARQHFHVGAGTIATPGVIRGLFTVHRDLGRMPLRQVIEPAVALARRGVALNAIQAYVLHVVRAIVCASPATQALFASRTDSDQLAGEGEVLRMPDLADALEILAIEGPDLFYRGEMGQRLIADQQALGGHLTREDLAGYRVERRPPLMLDVCRAQVALNPPPALGGILIAFGLRLWDALGASDGGFGSSAHLRRLVAVIDATARARVEAEATSPDAAQLMQTMLDPLLLARWRGELAALRPALRGTTQISVIDGEGSAAGLSISNGEGSGYVLPGTGIVLNNMLGEADLLPEGPTSRWPPATRLASMMAPALAIEADGRITVLGSGGSNRIRTAMLQALLNLLVFRMPLEDAVAAPRLHLEGGTLSIEPGFSEAAMASVEGTANLHLWPMRNMFFGGVHAVRGSAAGAAEGAGDDRRGGSVGRA